MFYKIIEYIAPILKNSSNECMMIIDNRRWYDEECFNDF